MPSTYRDAMPSSDTLPIRQSLPRLQPGPELERAPSVAGSVIGLNTPRMTSRSGSVAGSVVSQIKINAYDVDSPRTALIPSNSVPKTGPELEAWLNEVLQAATRRKRAEEGVAKENELQESAALWESGVHGLGLSRGHLRSCGLTNENVDRLYRAIYVYTLGFADVLNQIVEQARDKGVLVSSVWRCYVRVLEEKQQTQFSTVIATMVREHDAEMRKLNERHCEEVSKLVHVRNELQADLKWLRNERVKAQRENANAVDGHLKAQDDLDKTRKGMNRLGREMQDVQARLSTHFAFRAAVNTLLVKHQRMVYRPCFASHDEDAAPAGKPGSADADQDDQWQKEVHDLQTVLERYEAIKIKSEEDSRQAKLRAEAEEKLKRELRTQLAEERKRCELLDASLKDTTEKLQKTTAAFEHFRQTCDDAYQERVQVVKDDLSSALGQLARERERADGNDAQLHVIGLRMTAMQDDCVSMHAEFNALNNLKQEAERLLIARDLDVAEEMMKRQSVERLCGQLRREIEELKEQIAVWERTHGQLRADLDRETKDLTDARATVAQLRDDVDAAVELNRSNLTRIRDVIVNFQMLLGDLRKRGKLKEGGVQAHEMTQDMFLGRDGEPDCRALAREIERQWKQLLDTEVQLISSEEKTATALVRLEAEKNKITELMQEQIQKARQRINSLELQLRSRENDLLEANQRLAAREVELVASVEHSDSVTRMAEQHAAYMERQREEHTLKIAEVEEQLRAARRESQRHSDEAAEYRDKLKQTSAEKDKLAARLAEMELYSKQLTHDMDDMHTVSRRQLSKIQVLQHELEAETRRTLQFQEAHNDLRALLASERLLLKTMEAERDEALGAMGGVREELEASRAQVEKERAEVARINVGAWEWRERVDELNGELEAQRAANARLAAQLRNVQAAQVDTLVAREHQMNEDMGEAKRVLDQVREQVTALEGEVRRLTFANNNLTNDLKELRKNPLRTTAPAASGSFTTEGAAKAPVPSGTCLTKMRAVLQEVNVEALVMGGISKASPRGSAPASPVLSPRGGNAGGRGEAAAILLAKTKALQSELAREAREKEELARRLKAETTQREALDDENARLQKRIATLLKSFKSNSFAVASLHDAAPLPLDSEERVRTNDTEPLQAQREDARQQSAVMT